jgi:hypothetical protein
MSHTGQIGYTSAANSDSHYPFGDCRQAFPVPRGGILRVPCFRTGCTEGTQGAWAATGIPSLGRLLSGARDTLSRHRQLPNIPTSAPVPVTLGE